MREDGDGSHQDLYYKFYDLKKQVTKTQLLADMHKQLQTAEQRSADLNRQNANLKFKC